MKMLFFEEKEAEKTYFKEHKINDFEITFFDEVLDKNTELTDKQYEETVVLSIFINSNITNEVISKFKNLMVVSTRSTGYNHIDIEACKKRNIAVINVEDYGKTSVAQYTIGVMITLVRNILTANEDVKKQIYNKNHYCGKDLSGMNLGVIGTGAIGENVCIIAKSLGMNILACDCVKNEKLKQYVNYCDFDNLLKNSDIITLHIPYSQNTYHLIGKNEFEKMKNGVYIINTARGELIDIEALYEALENKKVKGTALDVLECENLNYSNNDFVKQLQVAENTCLKYNMISRKLAEQSNVIITPHIAYNTIDSVNKILDTTFKSIKDYFKGRNTNLVF